MPSVLIDRQITNKPECAPPAATEGIQPQTVSWKREKVFSVCYLTLWTLYVVKNTYIITTFKKYIYISRLLFFHHL